MTLQQRLGRGQEKPLRVANFLSVPPMFNNPDNQENLPELESHSKSKPIRLKVLFNLAIPTSATYSITHTHTHKQARKHTYTQALTSQHTFPFSRRHTHTHTHRQTLKCTHIPLHAHTNTHPLAHTQSHTSLFSQYRKLNISS